MMIITGLSLSYLILHIHAQNIVYRAYYPANQSPESVVFPDRTNAARPLSTQSNDDYIRQVFGEPPKRSNGVGIEKNNEVSVTTAASGTTAPQAQSNSEGAPNRQAIREALQSAAPDRAGYNGHLFSVTDIGIKLLRNAAAQQSGNVVLSPYSISSLLALLQQGSDGETQKELNTFLGMTPAVSAAAYAAVSNDYKSRNTRNILRTANNVFVGDSFTINSNFKRIAQTQFDSDITPATFGRPAVAARQINNWVSMKTNNQIDKIVSPESIDGTTQLVLVNAVYFKGLWDVPFNPRASYDGKFHLSNEEIKQTEFMRMKRLINHGVDKATNAQVVVLPFEGNQYSMMVILPSEVEGITRTMASLTSDRLVSYFGFGPVETQLELPKFTVKADTDLAPILKNMGLTRMFGPYAELDGLGRYRASNPQISSAVHSAVLSIDEHGAKAAAATSFAAVALSYEEPAQLFKANRPFIVILWDTVTSLPLFMAKVTDPTQ